MFELGSKVISSSNLFDGKVVERLLNKKQFKNQPDSWWVVIGRCEFCYHPRGMLFPYDYIAYGGVAYQQISCEEREIDGKLILVALYQNDDERYGGYIKFHTLM